MHNKSTYAVVFDYLKHNDMYLNTIDSVAFTKRQAC
jgi:hypothetical protein